MNKPNSPTIQWFRNAAPYINAHRGKTVVLAFGGEALAESNFPTLIHDIALLSSLGIRLVLVHGIRPQIEKELIEKHHQSEFHKNLRITDTVTLKLAQQAAGSVRVQIEALLSTGLANTPMEQAKLRVASGNHVIAQPVGVLDGIDHLHTGKVRKIDTHAIQQQLDLGNIVLLSPVGYSLTGEIFNLSAEDVAIETAKSLKADKLIFMMECDSLCHANGQRVEQLNAKQARLIIDNEKQHPHLSDEVMEHLSSAASACDGGVKRVHLISRLNDGALLQELYTRDGEGCLITNDVYEDIRKATIDDVAGILGLISPLEDEGVLVYRSREQLELEIDYFTVIEKEGTIIGCVALYPFADEKMAELACIVIHPNYASGGRGDALLKHTEAKAWDLGIDHLFVLTTQTAHWFAERGFEEANLDNLPVQKQGLYNLQRNSKIFVKSLD